MSENTKIEWCDHTFNPWEGCQHAGPGCDGCYAEARNARFGGGTAPNWGPGAPRRRTSAANWALPKRWNAQAATFMAQHGRRQRVFCASLADVFDNAVDPQWRADLFALIAQTPNLDWLLLTKRIGNVCGMLAELAHGNDPDLSLLDMMPLPNVWIGATIVTQAEADRDIPKLLAVPARVRFLSMEPLLGPVDLGAWIEPWDECGNCGASFDFEAGRPDECPECGKKGCMCTGFGSVLRNDFDDADGRIEVPELPGIDWVIVGGESGSRARPMHPDWARSLRDQCRAAGVPFLFKQWGNWRSSAWFDGPDADDDSGDAFVDLERTDHVFIANDGRTWDTLGGRLMYPPLPLGHWCLMVNEGKKSSGRLLDGLTWDEAPQP